MKKHIVIATAGHIDHGKTALVQAISGVDTDRLKVEKERGITTELGFAHLESDSGTLISFVDVPGHEKFIRHMVSGVSSVDTVLFVVSAEESVMPQTREHFQILRLLDAKRGIIAVTKSDLADPEMRELAKEEIKDLAKGSFLENAPVVETSIKSGDGLEELRKLILDLEADHLPDSRVFRMPIDRVFTLKGHGTVVTGTIVGGSTSSGDKVMAYPSTLQSKIREIQVGGSPSETSTVPLRTAINIPDISTEELQRGEILSHPGSIYPTTEFSAEFHHLENAPAIEKKSTRGLLHITATHLEARMDILGQGSFQPGCVVPVRIRTEKPLAIMRGDRFILRGGRYIEGFGYTIGGGIVLDPSPLLRKIRKTNPGLYLEEMKDDMSFLKRKLEECERGTLSASEIHYFTNSKRMDLLETLRKLAENETIVRIGESSFALKSKIAKIKDEILEHLQSFHKENPYSKGVSREELRQKRALEDSLFRHILEELKKETKADIHGNLVFIPGAVSERPKEFGIIEKLIQPGSFQTPTPDEVAESSGMTPKKAFDILKRLCIDNILVQIDDNYFIHKETEQQLLEKLKVHFEKNETLNIAQFKEISGQTRKNTIALLEYLDSSGKTVRKGSERFARNLDK